MARKDEPPAGTPSGRERFGDEIGRKEARKIRGRAERRRSPWFWAGMFGLVGWSVAVPTALGAWAGMALDERYPGQVSWTLSGVVLGVALGCLNAWLWVKRESTRED